MAGDPTLPRESGRRASREASGHLTGGGSAVAGARLLRAGLLGRGIESRSPQMHEAEGARLGLRYEYRLFDFDRLALRDAELPRLMTRLREEGFSGSTSRIPSRSTSSRISIGYRPMPRRSARSIRWSSTLRAPWGTIPIVGDSQKASAEGSAGRVSKRSSFLAPAAAMAVARALQDLGVRRLAIFDTNAAKAARLVAAVNSDPGPTGAVVAEDREAALLRAEGW